MLSFAFWGRMVDSKSPFSFLLAALACCLIAPALTLPSSPVLYQQLGFPEINASTTSPLGLLQSTTSLQIAPKLTEPLLFQIGGLRPSHSPNLTSFPLGVSRRLPQCHGLLYGRPNYDSCAEAWDDIPDRSDLQTFGNKGNGEYNVYLPFRLISRRSNVCTSVFG